MRATLAERRRSLSDMAKAKYKGEGVAPAWELSVAGRQVQRSSVRSITGSYQREAGASQMALEADFPFGRFEEEMVELRLGYGDQLVEYFTGRLLNPDRNSVTGLAACTVQGPFALMQESFGREIDFTGESVAHFFVELGSLARQPGRFLEVEGGYDAYLEDEAAFARETELVEAARLVGEKMDFVLLDRPGYRRKVMPTPAPGARAKSITRYDEGDYSPGAFAPKLSTSPKYARVNVFRRDDEGNYEVDEWFEVASRGRVAPPAGRIYYVPDFPGDARQARNTARRKAQVLSRGNYTWELLDVWINPELLLYDTVEVVRSNFYDYDVPVLEVFSCLLDADISWEISPGRFHMSLSGETAMLASVTPLVASPGEAGFARRASLSLADRGIFPRVTPESVVPAGVLAGSVEYTVADLADYTIEELS